MAHEVTVICPNHLVKQWEEEVKKNAKHLKVVAMSTISHHKKVSYGDVREAGAKPTCE